MQVKSTSTIVVTSRTLEIIKRPKDRNLSNRNVSISLLEKTGVTLNDKVILKVFDTGDNLVTEAVYTGVEFHSQLVPRHKRSKDGNKLTPYFLLAY